MQSESAPAVPMLDTHDNKVKPTHFLRMSSQLVPQCRYCHAPAGEPCEAGCDGAEGRQRAAEPKTWLAALPVWADFAPFVGRGDIGTLCLCEVIPLEQTAELGPEVAWMITRRDTRTLTGSEAEELYREGKLSGVGKIRPVVWSIEIVRELTPAPL